MSKATFLIFRIKKIAGLYLENYFSDCYAILLGMFLTWFDDFLRRLPRLSVTGWQREALCQYFD